MNLQGVSIQNGHSKRCVPNVQMHFMLTSRLTYAIVHLPDGSNGVGSCSSVKERAKYIPLRLSLGERKMLRLVEAAMTCCDYTTEVDRPFKSAARRTHAQLKGITSVLRGLVTACDYKQGQVRDH